MMTYNVFKCKCTDEILVESKKGASQSTNRYSQRGACLTRVVKSNHIRTKTDSSVTLNDDYSAQLERVLVAAEQVHYNGNLFPY